jgi:hypothetical protein
MGETRPAVNSNSLRLCIQNFSARATFSRSPGLTHRNFAGLRLARRFRFSPYSCPKYGNLYSYFFRYKLYRAETHGEQLPSKLMKSFRPVFWLGVFRCERPR